MATKNLNAMDQFREYGWWTVVAEQERQKARQRELERLAQEQAKAQREAMHPLARMLDDFIKLLSD